MPERSINFQHQIPITKLQPKVTYAESSSILGVVALIWPYSSANKTFSFLLAEPDFRLRDEQGQVLVRLYGSSAKAVARCGIINGDEVQLSLTGAAWVRDDSTFKKPGKGIGWDLNFQERVIIQISHPGQDPVCLDIDHPTPSPEPEIQTFASHRSYRDDNHEPLSWSSPAFLKRSHLPYATYFKSEFDPFQDSERFEDNGRNKRLKFGRKSDQWAFVESSPTSEKELEIEDLEDNGVASPTPTNPENHVGPSTEEPEFDLSRLDEAIGYLPSGGETKIPFDMDQIMDRFKIDEGQISSSSAIISSEKLSPQNQKPSPNDATPESRANYDIMDAKIPFDDEKTPGFDEQLRERETPVLNSSVDRGPPQVEQSAPAPLDNQISFENQSTPNLVVQKNPEFVQNASSQPEATGLRAASATSSNDELMQLAAKPHSYPPEAPETDKPIVDPGMAPSDLMLTISSETENESDSELEMGSEDLDRRSNKNTPLVSPPKSTYSDPITISSDNDESESYSNTDSYSINAGSNLLSEAGMNSDDSMGAGELFDQESADTASDDFVEENPASQVIHRNEISHDGKPRADGQEQLALSPVHDRHKSTDREVYSDPPSRRNNNLAPLISHSKKAGNSSEVEETSFGQPQSHFVNASDQADKAYGSDQTYNNTSNITHLSRSVANFERTKGPLGLDGVDSSALAVEDFKDKSALQAGHPYQESNSVIDAITDSSITQAEPTLVGEDVYEEVKLSSAESRQRDVFDLPESGRHTGSSADISVKVKNLYIQEEKLNNDAADLQTINEQNEYSEDSEEDSDDEDDYSRGRRLIRKSFKPFAENEIDNSIKANNDQPERAASTQKPVTHIIDLESENEDDVPTRTWMKKKPILPPSDDLIFAEQNQAKDDFSSSRINVKSSSSSSRSVSSDAQSEKSGHSSLNRATQIGQAISDPNRLETVGLPSLLSKPVPFDANLQSINIVSEPSISVLEAEIIEDREVKHKSRNQLLTPKLSQKTSLISEQSALSHLNQNIHDLPTPAPTQSSSGPPVLLKTPERSHKPTFIEKLKAIRNFSAETSRSRTSSNSLNAVSPWFAQKNTSQISHVSDSEGDGDSQSTDYDLTDPKSDGKEGQNKSFLPAPPERQSALVIGSSPSHLTSAAKSPSAGFRTSYSYFAPLSTLSSHYNARIDVLAIVLAATSIARAISGPRDYNQTISITDPSLVSSPNSVVIAQIFRPHKTVFPSTTQGDSILLRNFKIQSFQNVLGLVSTEESAWAVFRKDAEVQIKGPPVEFGAEERGFARGLWGWWGSLGMAKKNEFERALEKNVVVKGEWEDVSEDEHDETNRAEQYGLSPKKTPWRSGRNRPRGRPSRGEGVVRHELRDGVSYTDGTIEGKGSVHELRDGTTYSDGVER